MSKDYCTKLKHAALASLAALSIAAPGSAMAETEWVLFTMDNDTFVGNDNGYTNGIYVSWLDSPEGKPAEIGFLARAMKWSLPDSGSSGAGFSSGTIGQTMITPDDIEEDPPTLPPDDLPYGGLLFYVDTFIQVHDRHADSISVTLGVVGEYSFAEESQEFVHDVISSDEPCCWDEQLDDEVVFQVSRGRVWKTWVSNSGNSDFLLSADLALGTISSSVGAGFMVRYGRQMKNSFATALLYSSRTTNPVSSQTGWYLFAGARASYLGNQVFLDSSRSYDDDFDEIDYQEDRVSVTAGLAYSWKEWSFTFAMNDLNVNEDSDNDSAEEYSEYGTFTLAWKLD
jgi:hypothetical protein